MEGSNRSGREGRWIRTRMVGRGRKRELRNSSTAAVARVGVDVASRQMGDSAGTRQLGYPPKRPKVFAIRSWPPNCGPRKRDGHGGGGVSTVTVDGARLFEEGEEEDEPEEGPESEPEEELDGGRDVEVDGGGGIEVTISRFVGVQGHGLINLMNS
ncbi:unnamed protein product [Linum trigynum]|uniref:Uncharacterized protein n=1 Tax=Linum trigynum TaxID=586398 RepID=A0AAV2FWS6_9ROSI